MQTKPVLAPQFSVAILQSGSPHSPMVVNSPDAGLARDFVVEGRSLGLPPGIGPSLVGKMATAPPHWAEPARTLIFGGRSERR